MQTLHYASTAFMLAATVSGFLFGSSLPARVSSVLHPMIVTGLSANAGGALLGSVTGAGYTATVQGYLTKVQGPLACCAVLSCAHMVAPRWAACPELALGDCAAPQCGCGRVAAGASSAC